MEKVSKFLKIFYLAIPLAVLLLYLSLNYGSSFSKDFESTHYVLDTFVTVKIFDPNRNTEKDVSEVFSFLKRMEDVFNFYSTESELSKINEELKSRGFARLRSQEMREVAAKSLELAEMTGGAFDPTLGELTRLWAFDRGGRLPDRKEIDAALKNSGFEKISVSGNELKGSRGMTLDLGAIAKGFCLEKAAEILKEKGYRKFLINSVSTTIVYNTLDSKPVKVGIEHPRKRGLLAVVPVYGSAVLSTSADNQKFFEFAGKRYHHILDPRTGYPARGTASLTVAGSIDGATADALSTALFVMGPSRALRFAKNNGLKVILYTEEGKIFIYPQSNWIQIQER